MLNDYKAQGRLTATPELKTTPSGKKTVSFSVAIDRNGKDAGTDFISFVAWEKTAEFIAKNFVKGQQILIEARLQSRSITDKKTEKPRTVVDVVVNQVHFCGSKPVASKSEVASDADDYNEDEYIPS